MSQSFRPAQNKAGYLRLDTVAAITTGVGGAIAMIRVSGPLALECPSWLAGENSAEIRPERTEERKLVRTPLHTRQGAPLDDALVVRFIAPQSFTGEDVVEFHLHGSPFIASQVLEQLASRGVRQALPGEFSFRAVRNGKMTLSQAEAVADLISAANGGAVSLALEKMSGTQNRLLGELATKLRRLAVLGEVGIDFSDQDVEEVSLPNLKKWIGPIRTTLERLRDSYQRGRCLQDGISVAFIGLPNVGKSSFFNALLGEERSIVSEIAGTTRDTVRERLTLGTRDQTITLRLEDTAGLRETENQIEKMGIERTQRAASEADLVLFLADSTSAAGSPEQVREQWRLLNEPAQKTIGILTKSDLALPEGVQSLRDSLAPLCIGRWLSTSSATGEGISEAVREIIEYCTHWTHREKGEVLLTRLDQLESVQQALEHLNRAEKVEETDLFAADVRHALNSLGLLIGDTLPDDILGQIFSDFCIGK